jgi:hypothetical protein
MTEPKTPRMKPQDEISFKILGKLPRLLNMEYLPEELAEELGITSAEILHYLATGCPARKDDAGVPWIHGLTFIDWAKTKHQLEKACAK